MWRLSRWESAKRAMTMLALSIIVGCTTIDPKEITKEPPPIPVKPDCPRSVNWEECLSDEERKTLQEMNEDEKNSEHNPFYHVLMFDWRGQPVDPTGNYDCSSEGKNGDSVDVVDHEKSKKPEFVFCGKDRGRYNVILPFNNLELENYKAFITRLFVVRDMYRKATGNNKVLIFVHGGLNRLDKSTERAVKYHKLIEAKAADPGYFPIFINWQSNLTSSYLDHLYNIRQGEEWPPPTGWPLAPFVFAADLIRAVGQAALTWGNQFQSDLESVRGTHSKSIIEAKKVLDGIRDSDEQQFQISHGGKCPNLPEQENGDCRTSFELMTALFKWLVTLPTKIVSGPFIDALGTSAWNSMLRTSHLLFHSEQDFHPGSKIKAWEEHQRNKKEVEGIGGLSVFMRLLKEKIKTDPEKWEITLVGHSMGTIVINEMLRRFPDIRYDDIVYMAAACSIREYEDSVFPYLNKHGQNQQRQKEHEPNKPKPPQVYHLMLHEQAEVGETLEYVDLPPRGSLLVWVDNFFSKPKTHLDRRLGRWTNLALAVHNTPKEMQEQIFFKVFALGESTKETNPQRHGEFNEFPFWRETFWKPEEEVTKRERRIPENKGNSPPKGQGFLKP